MNSNTLISASLLLALFHVLWQGVAWSHDPRQQPTQPKPAGEGWVLGVDERMFPPAGASGQHFHQARAEILNGSLESARDEIRKGTAYLFVELSRATEKGKKLLEASIGELEHLTEILGKAENNYYALRQSGFEQIFARSGLALAKDHELRAREAWRQKKPEETGRQLKSAMLHLRHAWAWLGNEAKAESERVMKEEAIAGLVLTRGQLIEADTTARALVKGTGWTDGRVESGLTNIGKEIDSLQQAAASQRTANKR